MKKTIIRQAIDLLEQQRKSLQEMDVLGVLLENELTHKSNQINTIQLMLSNLIISEQEQFINFHIEVMKRGLIEEGEKKWKNSYEPQIRQIAESVYEEWFEIAPSATGGEYAEN